MAANTCDAVSAGHTEGPWHIHYKADHKDGADLPWIGGHMGKPLAFITHETILKEDLERANCNARLIVAACNSYDRQCGERAIEAAEADLLGRCLEFIREFEAGASHTRVFLTSREKMHETGVALFDNDIAEARAILSLAEKVKP